MARHEADREDIFREATALVERAELSVPGEGEPVVIGFRRDGSASIFFGGDAAYHFSAAGEVRRAYLGGLLYKAERGRLVELNRQRTDNAVVLLARELSPEECDALLLQAGATLVAIARALAQHSAVVRRVAPAGGNVAARIADWLAKLPARLAIARSPRAGS